MAYSEEVKQKILNRIENGDKIKDISEETGISIPTLYNWRNKANLSKENQGKGETNKGTKKENKIVGFKQLNENTKEKTFIMQAIEQSKIIKKLIKEKKFEEAKRIGKRFPYNTPIQSQMVTIAIQEGDLKRAKEIGEKFPNNKQIQHQIKVNSKINRKNNKKKILDSLKTKLYFDKVDDQLISEIELSQDLDEFEKIVSLLAICEKRNMKEKAKQVLKTFHPTDKQEKSIVNGIMDRIKSKKPQIFDIVKYDLILHWSFNHKLKAQYEEELKVEREEREAKKRQITLLPKTETTQSIIKPVEKHPKALIHSGEKLDKSAEYRKKLEVTSLKTSNEQLNIINHRNNEKKNVNNQTQMMINYIHEFIQEQREKVYVNMQSKNVKIQSDAISKWDRIEILLERIAEKSKDTQYIKNLYNRVLNLSKSSDKGMEY